MSATAAARRMAKKIPDAVRSQRLLVADDPILNARAQQHDPHMELLYGVYYEFVEPFAQPSDKDPTCPKCLARVVTMFWAMRPALEELERDYQLLNALKP